MFNGIISTILISFSTIFRKKALGFTTPSRIFALFSYSGTLLLVIIFILLSKYDFSGLNLFIIFLILLVVILSFTATQISQYVYKNEKISVITPYENITKILSIILAFFIFSDISTLSFFITLFAGIIIIAFSINLKTLKIPKLIKLFSISQVISSINLILIGYILNSITNFDYIIIDAIFYILILLIVLFFTKELKYIFNQKALFYKYRITASCLGSLSYFINLTIISTMGVTISILFSYMYIGFILVLSFLFFKDKPTKKSIILTIILAILVGLGYYYK